ncbi:SOUL family heme-binding protein [Micromonospora sp. CPCC 205561]|uniref:SOUL family heme-binding protein n=1 Tax=Micromonospora sp. CPCC 205561 TaxID=3122407 RepID=UPI002FF3AD5C
MAEQQPYRVVSRHPGFELRRYPAHLVAEVRAEGGFEQAARDAFRSLAGYVAGAGRRRGPDRVARGAGPGAVAPFVQEEGDRPGRWLAWLVLPAGLTPDALPEPADPRIHTREVPEQLAAAARFAGRWTARAFDRRATTLGRAVTAAGLRPTGAVRYARFDPPWKPWFLRHNEVVLPVAE